MSQGSKWQSRDLNQDPLAPLISQESRNSSGNTPWKSISSFWSFILISMKSSKTGVKKLKAVFDGFKEDIQKKKLLKFPILSFCVIQKFLGARKNVLLSRPSV